MGDPEKRVLRRRRQQIASCMGDSQDAIRHLHDEGILAKDSVDMLQAEHTETERVSKLVDLLYSLGPRSFHPLCDLLETRCPWLRDEMLADFQAETGALQIDHTIHQEAAELVHRRFGTSRRLSQVDKRDISVLIATRAQIVKESWRRHLKRIEDDLQKATGVLRQTQEQVLELNAKIKSFVRQNEFFLSEPFLDMKSTTDVLFQRKHQKTDPVQELTMRVDMLITRILRYTLKESRTPPVTVDSNYVQSLKKKISVLEEEIKEKTRILQKQEILISEKEKEVRLLNKKIEILESDTIVENVAPETRPSETVERNEEQRTSPTSLPCINTSSHSTSRPHRCDRKCLKRKD